MNTKRLLALVAVPSAFALGLGAYAAGHTIGATTYDARSTAYVAGYDKARSDFCNLQLDGGEAVALDSRRVPGLDDNLLAADASCEDWQITAWNAAQERAGGDQRACRFDERQALVNARLDVTPCVAPVDLN